ncbi:protein tyrosine phosphatase domain-containing protein 1 [Dicentrarchus labrax]|uniref:Protein tyrosine phosphatase domain-containing protein 1 n=1 Tax=Dicentrarchus labrax TaxID=13489 RepID=A0A8C4ISN3_DICLA|nr:protein tyrosine phosphatase domain-containing protein 1 [Dicentrarchus labrax]XP_051270956.1 protein tyrosine phosphatase domain-containing protein 1 [Dicentrarchus labrax]
MAAGVSVLSDLSYSMSGARSGEISTEMETANARVPTAKYTKMGETLRHVIPGHMQCSMACGGKACKYENPSRWSDEEQAVKGLYSSWITDNLLAMARPSTEIIEKYNIIEQFQRCGLKTVINLQRPGEHASCGNPLEQESGFTYRPEIFMEAGIYYYNFGWKDYGVASLTTILDMVKVMSFAVQEGKLAVHCHAGLGRTGVLLACYLVFTSRMSADQAILFVRAKRPNSIQTRGQLLCVREFAQFLVPLRSVFSCAEPKASAVTLSQYLTRQRHLLHGYEARQMKNVPKIVQLVCRLLVDIAANRQAVIEEEWLEIPDLTAEVEKTVSQQALQQLGKEMRGKGIPVPPCSSHPLSPPALQSGPPHDQPLASDNELDPLWRQQNAESPLRSSLSNNRHLSYSDSVLHKLGTRQHHLENLKSNKPVNCLIKHSLSHNSLTVRNPPRFCDPSPQDFISSIQDPSTKAKQDTGSPFIKRHLRKGCQSLSLDLSEQGRRSNCNATLLALSTKSKLVTSEEQPCVDVLVGEGDTGIVREVPFIALQSELSPESRRLLVTKAVALDVSDKDLTSKVSLWQTELNSREGAWERLCMERDPLVLSSLMWSWLEQLKDPVISSEDIKALSEKNVNPQNALDSLEKGHRLTLLCILDCVAHLLPVPEEVETSFLNQTIKVFTKIDPASEKNESLYTTLRAILNPILHELQDKAAEENEDS